MLAAKQTSSGYSGQKADMWAAGVLMFVMLLGEVRCGTLMPTGHEGLMLLCEGGCSGRPASPAALLTCSRCCARHTHTHKHSFHLTTTQRWTPTAERRQVRGGVVVCVIAGVAA
jgi:hypothetical protein